MKTPLIAVLSLASALLFTNAAAMQPSAPVAGVDYKVLEPAVPTAVPAGKVEVTEIFWYGCPHCYRFEPYVKGWLKAKDDNVVFTLVPGIASPKWENHARFYYTAQALGALDKLHEPLFIAIHEKKQRLNKEEDLFDFAASRGVDREKFAQTFRSFSVNAKIQRARQLAQAYGVNSVPSVVINGKYVTGGGLAGSFENMVYIMHTLSKQELELMRAKEGAFMDGER